MIKRSLLAVVFASSMFAGAAYASPDSVAKGCAAGGDCVALVNAEIAGMTGSAADKNKAIADMVFALGTAAQSASSDAQKAIAEGIKTASASVTDAGQKAQIVAIADTIDKCNADHSCSNIDLASIDDGTSASDN